MNCGMPTESAASAPRAVEDRRVALVGLVEDRRRRRERDVRRHLVGDRLHRAADDLGGHRIDRIGGLGEHGSGLRGHAASHSKGRRARWTRMVVQTADLTTRQAQYARWNSTL